MTEEELKARAKEFGLRAIRLVNALPGNPVARVLGNQLLRSATSVGANYRAACRGRSLAEFISKLGNVEEEADESVYWLEMIMDSGVMERPLVEPLWMEANELTAMIVASRKTAKGRNQ